MRALLRDVMCGILGRQFLLFLAHAENNVVFLRKSCLVTALLHDFHLLVQGPGGRWGHSGLRIQAHGVDTGFFQLAQALKLLEAQSVAVTDVGTLWPLTD